MLQPKAFSLTYDQADLTKMVGENFFKRPGQFPFFRKNFGKVTKTSDPKEAGTQSE
jgi:hypothetical protein